ncbi:MAG: DUF1385 domain-containing protein, partial [Clostridiales bacterium]|nr:DUF1385 domain-containing protein [Clostridiales bacterium]
VLSIGLFIVLPEIAASLFRKAIPNRVAVNLLGGGVRILILIGYMILCSFVPDVRRTFQYHGAEHKTVYCFENNLPLTPENAQTFSTLHPRCGTSFILIVFVLSILLYTVAGYNGSNYLLRVLSRLALLPFVAGISYEILKGLAHSDNPLVRALRWPGLMMQKLTTKQPDLQMLEVAIVAMESALYGLPQGEITPEGFTKIPSFEHRHAPVSDLSEQDNTDTTQAGQAVAPPPSVAQDTPEFPPLTQISAAESFTE